VASVRRLGLEDNSVLGAPQRAELEMNSDVFVKTPGA